MHRIDTPTAQKDKFGAGKNGFTAGNPQTGTPATDLDNDYFDMLQEELAGVVEATGVNLDKSKHNQLLTALKALMLIRAHPFADIKADGPAAIAEALSNLGLGELALAGTITGVFDTNGYLKIPAIIGGAKRTLIVQWGLASGTTGKIATTYATTFPNAVLQVICSVADKSTGSGAVTLAVNQADVTSLASRTTVTITPSSSDFQGTTTARFISIGY
ncbi:TPA: gp53-like domain-containing protein [Citrobacter braakii]